MINFNHEAWRAEMYPFEVAPLDSSCIWTDIYISVIRVMYKNISPLHIIALGFISDFWIVYTM